MPLLVDERSSVIFVCQSGHEPVKSNFIGYWENVAAQFVGSNDLIRSVVFNEL
jgi:hypothetical protein